MSALILGKRSGKNEEHIQFCSIRIGSALYHMSGISISDCEWVRTNIIPFWHDCFRNVGKWLQTPGDASSDYTAVISSTSSFANDRSFQKNLSMKPSGSITDSSSIVSGITDTLDLMRHIGEGYRLLCMYRCQVLLIQKTYPIWKRGLDIILMYKLSNNSPKKRGKRAKSWYHWLALQEALNVYQKLPQKHYNTAWILSQVMKIVSLGINFCWHSFKKMICTNFLV